jgi:hypothetical protein
MDLTLDEYHRLHRGRCEPPLRQVPGNGTERLTGAMRLMNPGADLLRQRSPAAERDDLRLLDCEGALGPLPDQPSSNWANTRRTSPRWRCEVKLCSTFATPRAHAGSRHRGTLSVVKEPVSYQHRIYQPGETLEGRGVRERSGSVLDSGSRSAFRGEHLNNQKMD